MKALIVEDDRTKAGWIEEVFVERGWTVTKVLGAASCLDELRGGAFDILVLDLLIPWEGIDLTDIPDVRNSDIILSEISAGRCMPPGYVVGITQDRAIQSDAQHRFGLAGWIVLHYTEGADWRRMFADRIDYAELQESNGGATFGIDLAIVTALADPEAKAVLELCPELVEIQTSGLPHWRGDVVGRDCALFTTAEMGVAASAALVATVVERFRPRLVAMCGICAGVKGEVNLGDVIIADKILDYSAGKISEVRKRNGLMVRFYNNSLWEFLPTTNVCEIDHDLAGWLRGMRGGLIERWWRPQGADEFDLKVGVVACGPFVVAHRELVNWLRAKDRKILGLEMEFYGAGIACKTARSPRPKFIGLKGVSDFADPDKNEDGSRRIRAARNSVRALLQMVHFGVLDL